MSRWFQQVGGEETNSVGTCDPEHTTRRGGIPPVRKPCVIFRACSRAQAWREAPGSELKGPFPCSRRPTCARHRVPTGRIDDARVIAEQSSQRYMFPPAADGRGSRAARVRRAAVRRARAGTDRPCPLLSTTRTTKAERRTPEPTSARARRHALWKPCSRRRRSKDQWVRYV